MHLVSPHKNELVSIGRHISLPSMISILRCMQENIIFSNKMH